MNKTKQEMLALVDKGIYDLEHDYVYLVRDSFDALRTLITDSVILSDGEIDGMRPATSGMMPASTYVKDINNAVSEALDKIKEMK